MIEDPDVEDYLVEAAAYGAAAAIKNPLLFWFKFLEALWSTP